MEDNNRNAFIDDGGLSKSTSLTHLLNENDNIDSDNIEVIEHSPYYSEADFQKLNTLSMMSLTCQSINAKKPLIDRINKSGSHARLVMPDNYVQLYYNISFLRIHV